MEQHLFHLPRPTFMHVLLPVAVFTNRLRYWQPMERSELCQQQQRRTAILTFPMMFLMMNGTV
eukprot:scaffold7510_cov46-Attheya_sp.AAC.3